MTPNQHKNKKIRHNHLFEERSTIGKLINRILGSCLLISSLPGSALRTHVDIARQASRYQQAFSKPCLVNLISKDTNLVFSIYDNTCAGVCQLLLANFPFLGFI